MANVEYPIIVSKIDPLIIRINALSLVVGSCSFSAKVKLGSSYTGFHVYASAIGEPIAKVAVSIQGYNNTTIIGNTGRTMAYKHIEEEATKWLDVFQDSFAKATSQKNVVDLLRELKAQIHYDFSGHIPADTDIVIDSSTPLYLDKIEQAISNIVSKVDSLQDAINDINKAINSTAQSDNSISYRLSKIEIALGTETDDTFGNVIAKSITDGLSDLTGEMRTMNTNITNVNDNVTTVRGKVDTVNTTVNTINGNVNTVKSDVSTVKSDVGTVKTNVNTVSSNVDNVKSTVNTIHSTDVPDIKSTVTSSSGGTDQSVSNLASTVNSMNGTVNNINGTVNSISGTVGTINTRTYNTWNKLDVLDTGTLNDVLCGSDSVVIGDSTDGYFVRTELTKDDMITGPSGDKRVKADTN